MSTSADLDELALSYELMKAMMTPDNISSYKPSITPNYKLIEDLREAMETSDNISMPLHNIASPLNCKQKEALKTSMELLNYLNIKLMAELAEAMQDETTSSRR